MLERKVNELASDNDDLRTQLLKTKDTLSTTSHAKEEIYKKMASISKTAQEHKRLSMQEISELENAQQRIFELEEEMKRYKRKAEVDLPNEVNQLDSLLELSHLIFCFLYLGPHNVSTTICSTNQGALVGK
jgi:hypothetical protein